MTKLISWERAVYPKISALSEKMTPVILHVLYLLAGALLFFYHRTEIVNRFLILELLCFTVLAVLHYRSFRPKWLLILMGLNVIFLPISLLKNGGYGVGIVYVCLVISLVVFNSITLSRRTAMMSHLMVAIMLTFVLGVADQNYYYYIAGNRINQNTYGILALACALHWLCAFEQMRIKKGYRLLGRLCGLILGVSYIMESGCRSALLAYVVLLFLLLVIWKPFPTKWRWSLLTLFAAGCFLFTIVYLYMSEHMDDILLFQKTLFSGREIIWKEALALLRKHAVLGIGNTQLTDSMHNTMLQIWYSLGVIPFLTVTALLGYGVSFPKHVRTARCAQLAFISCLMIAFFESFLADPYLYLFFASFLLTHVRSDRTEESQ